MIFKFILDLIAPKKCYSCKKEGHFLCDKCFNELYDFENVCYACKGTTKKFEIHKECKNKVYYDKIIILKHYKQGGFDKHIKNAKFYNKKEIFEELSNHMYEKFLRNQKINFLNNFVIISVPSYITRRLIRSYNSSEILAKYFSKKSKIKYDKNTILKIKNTRQQSKLSRQERLINLNNSFKINKNKLDIIANKKIIIIDDVISTGSTINEISKLLKQNGASEIIGICIASN